MENERNEDGGRGRKKCRKKKRWGRGKEMKKKVLERVNNIYKLPIRVIRKGGVATVRN